MTLNEQLTKAIAQHNYYEVLELIKKGADINNFDHYNPLADAVYHNDFQMVKLLATHPKIQQVSLRDALNQALVCAEDEMADFISKRITSNAFVWLDNSDTPVMEAIKFNNPKVLDNLLKNGLPTDPKKNKNTYLLHYAAEHYSSLCIPVLIKHGISVHQLDQNDQTALQIAVQKGYFNTAKTLLQEGAYIQPTKIPQKATIGDFFKAASFPVLAPFILNKESEISPKRHLFFDAILSEDKQTIELIYQQDKNFDINAEYKNYGTPLLYAIKRKKEKSIDSLIQLGANINLKVSGKTPLYSAIENSNYKVVTELLKYQPNVNLLSNGEAPLHLAVKKSNESVTKLLLEQGADIDIRNNDGLLPLDIAKENNCDRIIELLSPPPPPPFNPIKIGDQKNKNANNFSDDRQRDS